MDKSKTFRKSLQKQAKEIKKAKAMEVIGKLMIIGGVILAVLIALISQDLTRMGMFLKHWKLYIIIILMEFTGGVLLESCET